MGTARSAKLLRAPLEDLILKLLRAGATHSHSIAQRPKYVPEGALQLLKVLWPVFALRTTQGLAKAGMGCVKEQSTATLHTNSQRRKQLDIERQTFDRLVVAIDKFVNAT